MLATTLGSNQELLVQFLVTTFFVVAPVLLGTAAVAGYVARRMRTPA